MSLIETEQLEMMLRSLGFARGPLADGPNTDRGDRSLILVPSRSRPRLGIPALDRGAAERTLDLYHPRKRVPRLAKIALALGIRLGALPLWARYRGIYEQESAASHGSSIGRHLEEVMGESDLRLGVSFGTFSPDRKPVFQLMRPGGEVVGYAKVGWNEPTIELVGGEEGALARIGELVFSTVEVPKVLHSGRWKEGHLLVQSPPSSRPMRAPGAPSPLHLAFLTELFLQTRSDPADGLSHHLDGISRRIEGVCMIRSSTWSQRLATTLARVRAAFVGSEVPTYFAHRDFAPWNTLCSGSRLFVFDWEYSGPATPGWDLFHFLIQSGVLVHSRSGASLADDLMTGAARTVCEAHLRSIDVSIDLYEKVLAVYLLDVSSWYIDRDRVMPRTVSSPLLAAWGELLDRLGTKAEKSDRHAP